MRKTQPWFSDLPSIRPSLKLFIDFIDHPQARCADGMAETFQSAVRLTGNFSVKVEKTGFHIFSGSAPG
jgi:hypothetical protein